MNLTMRHRREKHRQLVVSWPSNLDDTTHGQRELLALRAISVLCLELRLLPSEIARAIDVPDEEWKDMACQAQEWKPS